MMIKFEILNSKIPDFDKLSELFFEVLAKEKARERKANLLICLI